MAGGHDAPRRQHGVGLVEGDQPLDVAGIGPPVEQSGEGFRGAGRLGRLMRHGASSLASGPSVVRQAPGGRSCPAADHHFSRVPSRSATETATGIPAFTLSETVQNRWNCSSTRSIRGMSDAPRRPGGCARRFPRPAGVPRRCARPGTRLRPRCRLRPAGTCPGRRPGWRRGSSPPRRSAIARGTARSRRRSAAPRRWPARAGAAPKSTVKT